MTSLWPDVRGGEAGVLRGAAASAIPAARMDSDLRTSPYVRETDSVDPRLVDPGLEAAFEQVANSVRETAQAAGFAAGWAQGRAAAMAEVREQAAAAEASRAAEERELRMRVLRATAALTAAAETLERRAVAPAEQIRTELVSGAVQLAELILGHEVTVSTSPGLDALHRAFDLAPHGSAITVRLHPEDRAAVAALIEDGLELGRPVTLVADASLARGDALAECDATRIDARMSSALARVAEVLCR